MTIDPKKRADFIHALTKASHTAQMLQSQLDEVAKIAIGGGTNLEHQMLCQMSCSHNAIRNQLQQASLFE